MTSGTTGTGPKPANAAGAKPGRSRFARIAFLFALVMRAAVVFLTRQLGIGLDDMFQYDMLARSLASGEGFRWYAPADAAYLAPYLNLDLGALNLDPRGMLTTFRAPLYPAFLAVVYFVLGSGPDRFFAARLVQAVLGAALAPLTYLAAIKILAHGSGYAAWVEKAARFASLIVATYPFLVAFPLALATENLFFPLLLASSLALLELPGPDQPQIGSGKVWDAAARWAVLAGILLGLSALTRSVILPFALAALAWIWFELRKPRLALLAGLALLGTIAPWMVRNSLVSGRLTGIETSMGYNLYLGYHPESTGTFTFGPSLDLLSILDDRERDQVGTQRALQFIREDPARFPTLALRRLGHFFDLESRAFTYFYSNGLLGTFSAPLVAGILAVLGLPFAVVAASATFGVSALQRRPATTILMLLFVFYLLPHVLILSEERFHLALLPFLAILCGAAWARFREHGPERAGFALALAVFGCLLLLWNWSAQIARTWPTLSRLIAAGGSNLRLPY